MDSRLYNKQIIRLAGSITRAGRLAAPDASASADSRLCGSRITIDITLNGETITDYAHELRACAIGQAVASVIAEVIVGLTVDEVEEGAEILKAILQERRPPPPGPWIGLEPFLPVADFRNRHGSALLPFQALQQAIVKAGIGEQQVGSSK